HLIERAQVLVNNETRRSSYRVRTGDMIEMRIPPPDEETTLVPEEIALDIIYEDADLLVVNNPQGMVVHPAAGHWKGTLVNALMNHCTQLSGINVCLRPGIVHRLDQDTPGLMLVRMPDIAHSDLTD